MIIGNKILKYIIIALYSAILAAMAAATFFTQDIADKNVYTAVWFSGLWAVLTAVSAVVFVKKLSKKLPVILFHF